MQKNSIVTQLIIALAVVVVIGAGFYLSTRKPETSIGNTQLSIIKKICTDTNNTTYLLWKDNSGNTKYIQIPAHPTPDQYYSLYDLSGNRIIEAGGLTGIGSKQKYSDLIQGLTSTDRSCK